MGRPGGLSLARATDGLGHWLGPPTPGMAYRGQPQAPAGDGTSPWGPYIASPKTLAPPLPNDIVTIYSSLIPKNVYT